MMAYAGLRPQEVRALTRGDVGERTLRIERAATGRRVKGTKNEKLRTVRLLAPLAKDLARWKAAHSDPSDDAWVFPDLGRADVVGRRVAELASTGVRASSRRRRRGRSAVSPEAFVRFVAAARREARGVRRAADRGFDQGDARHLHAPHRGARPRQPVADGRRGDRGSTRRVRCTRRVRGGRRGPRSGIAQSRINPGSRRADSNRGPLHYE